MEETKAEHPRPASDVPVLEAVPNISVGADAGAVHRIVAAVRRAATDAAGVPGGGSACVADVHLDPDHDRSVVTMFGHGEALAAALVELAEQAVDAIDLGAQHGVHPRVGALDVLPIIALDDLVVGAGTAADAERLLLDVAARIGSDLSVPVLRYGRDVDARDIPGAAFVGQLRGGGLAALAARMASGEHELLAGPSAPHATAGVVAAGLRPVLVALNVDLDCDDVEFAVQVAGRIRERSGGPDSLAGVRALGVELASRGLAQVTMNIERYRTVGPARAVERVAAIAAEAGVGVHRVELVGLAPAAAVAQLRYACSAVGAPLACATDPTIEGHLAGFMRDRRSSRDTAR